MNLNEKYNLWQIKTLMQYNDRTELVINENTNQVMIRKIMPESECEVHNLLSSVVHKNIIKVYDAVADNGVCMVLEQYVAGVTLEQFMINAKPDDDRAIDIIVQLCEGLEVLHNKNIIHRDITPTNIMIDEYGTVKIIDFDISKMPDAKSNRDTHILGTEGFAAPEQYGFKQSTVQTDIYAVGVLINYVKTGKMPDEAILSEASILPDIIARCIEFEPEKRYKNTGELLKDLYRYRDVTDGRIDSKENNEKKPLLERLIGGLPGIRSRYKSIRFFAFICYFCVLFYFYDTISKIGNPPALLENMIYIVFVVVIPFLFFSNYLSFQNKIFPKYSYAVKRAIFNALAAVSLIAGTALGNFF